MEITAALVKQLRDMTGAGMMDCKKALVESNGDINVAADDLRKKGIAKAAKKLDREIKDGIVFAALTEDKKAGAMITLGCETDFVARTEDFHNVAKQIINVVLTKNPETEEALLEATVESGEKVSEVITNAIAKIGENIKVGQFSRVEVPNGLVYSYIHFNEKIGVMLPLVADNTSDALAELGKKIALQAASMKPLYLDRSEVSEDLLNKEREIYKEEMKDSGKPEHVVAKIIENKIGKYYEENCLLEQQFVFGNGEKVHELIKEASKTLGAVSLPKFVRYGIGA